MRVITGTARGTVLAAPEGTETRPTPDRAKEALFSMLQFDLEGRTVLDLFTGSGQLALEALSRGAAHATMIDGSREAVAAAMANAKKTRLFDRCRITNTDFAAFLRAAAGKKRYDIVFLDPPYDAGLLPKALRGLLKGDLLAPGAIVACESEVPEENRGRGRRKFDAAEELNSMRQCLFGGDEGLEGEWAVLRNAVYGRVRMTLLGKKEETV